MKKEFSTLDVRRVLGIRRERLQKWVGAGFIKPSEPSQGQGRAATYSVSDLCRMRIFERLVGAGLSRSQAGFFLSLIEDERLRACDVFYVRRDSKNVLTGAAIPNAHDLAKAIRDVGNWSELFVVNLAQIRQEVSSLLA